MDSSSRRQGEFFLVSVDRGSPNPTSATSISGDARSVSSLVFGCRFFALATAAGTAGFTAAPRSSLTLIVVGVVLAILLAALQTLRLPRAVAWLFPWLHVGSWTLLIHATGGTASPLVLGYLLELPLSGVLLGGSGVAMAGIASITLHAAYVMAVAPPLHPAREGSLAALVALCAAITWKVLVVLERRRAEVQRSRERLADRARALGEDLQRLGHSLGDALVSIDGRGRIESLNPAAASLLGTDADQALGKAWQEVVRIDPTSRGHLAETVDAGIAHHSVPVILSKASGAPVTVRAHMWKGSSPDSGVHLLLDPGARSISEDDPLRKLGESAACVAHQIKNSMHSIQGYMGRIAPTTAATPPAEECLGALQGLSALAEDVLAMAGSSRAVSERVAIQDVLRSSLVLLSHPRVQLDMPQGPVHVQVRRSQLVHAIFNLLDNALRVSPPSDLVRVRVEQEDRRVVVEIDDAGPGIPEEVSRATGRAPSRGGAGWGLVAARRFVNASGGTLSLAAAEGGGTRCRLELPVAVS
jgi:signal transduction histidine kinase